jgi:hypothetical protein
MILGVILVVIFLVSSYYMGHWIIGDSWLVTETPSDNLRHKIAEFFVGVACWLGIGLVFFLAFLVFYVGIIH